MDRTNKHTPHFIYHVEERPEMFEYVHTMRLGIYVSKFKDGKFRPSIDRYQAWTGPKDGEIVDVMRKKAQQAILKDTGVILKKGRYHDWFYAPAII